MATGGRRQGKRTLPEAAISHADLPDGGAAVPHIGSDIPLALAATPASKTRRGAAPKRAAPTVSAPLIEAPIAAEPSPAPKPAAAESSAAESSAAEPIVAAEPASPPAAEPVATETAPDAIPTAEPAIAAAAAETVEAPAPEPVTIPEAQAPAAVTETKDMIMDATTQTIDQTQANSQALFSDFTARTQGAVEKSQKMFADVAEFNKGNVEALVESSKIAARGFETMGQDAVAYAKTSFEGMTQALKTLATVKSPTEFMKLQADYARSAFDAMVAQSSRSTEASLKLAGEVAQPISNRIAVATDKMKVSA